MKDDIIQVLLWMVVMAVPIGLCFLPGKVTAIIGLLFQLGLGVGMLLEGIDRLEVLIGGWLNIVASLALIIGVLLS